MTTTHREALVRVCDECGDKSMRPVWDGCKCSRLMAVSNGYVRCGGHFHKPAENR